MKIVRLGFIILMSFTLVTCKKEEVYKEIKEVKEQGLIIKHETKFDVLENANLEETISNDTIVYEGYKIPVYDIVVSGEGGADLKPGMFIIDNAGSGGFYMIIKHQGTKSSLKGIQGNWFKAVTPSLDFLYNYEGSIVQFSSPTNRSKRNSAIAGKLHGEVIADDEERFIIDDLANQNNWDGYDANREGGLINISFTDAEIKLGQKNKVSSTEASVSLVLDGFLHVAPAVDFLMEYNPEYHKTSNNELVAFIQAITNTHPVVLFEKSALALGTLKQLKAIGYVDLDYGLKAKLVIEGAVSAENKVFEKTIGRFTQIYPAGPVPISYLTEVIICVDLELAGKIEAEYYFQNENDIVFGFNLIKTGITENNITWYREVDSRTESGGALIAEIELEAGIKLKIKNENYIAGVIGPKLEAWGYIKGSIDFWASTETEFTSWDISVDAGLAGQAKFDLSMFHYDRLTWSPFVSGEKTFAEYNIYQSPYKVEIVSGNDQTGSPNQQLPNPIIVSVVDKFNKPIPSFMPPLPVYFGGDGVVSDMWKLTSNAEAQTSWTLDSFTGEQKILAALKNKDGGSYGEVVVRATCSDNSGGETPETGTVTDIDGYTYKTVKIGEQWWMAENLGVSKFNDGTAIPLYNETTDYSTWQNLTIPGYCYQWNVIDDVSKRDRTFYNGYVIETNNVCPDGWHVPTSDDWKELEKAIGLTEAEVNSPQTSTELVKKLLSETGWIYENGTNETGFNLLPIGALDSWGGPEGHGYATVLWTSSSDNDGDIYDRAITDGAISRFSWEKYHARSVRCVKD